MPLNVYVVRLIAPPEVNPQITPQADVDDPKEAILDNAIEFDAPVDQADPLYKAM